MTAPPIDPDTRALELGHPRRDGYRYEWHEERAEGMRAWRATAYGDERQCRWTDNRVRCEFAVRAEFNRGHGGEDRWWGYCSAHLYGRTLHDGKVWSLRLVPLEVEE
jgi:hypothetical protein